MTNTTDSTFTISRPDSCSPERWDALVTTREERAAHRAYNLIRDRCGMSQALLGLAIYHAHGWASYARVDARGALDFPAIERDMEAAEEEGVHLTPGGAGIRPSRSHTTGTGRLSWAVLDGRMTLQVHRPASCIDHLVRIDGDVIVLEIVVALDGTGTVESVYIDAERAEGRHYETLADAYYAGFARELPKTFHRPARAETHKNLVDYAQRADSELEALAALYEAELLLEYADSPADFEAAVIAVRERWAGVAETDPAELAQAAYDAEVEAARAADDGSCRVEIVSRRGKEEGQ